MVTSYFREDPRTREIVRLLEESGQNRIRLAGLSGSSRALVASAVFEAIPSIHCFILPDRESAAYFCNDLEQIFGEKEKESEKKQVLFFPSSFRKQARLGNKDNMGLLARTEVLNRLHSREGKFIMVSYPEALSEKVVNREFLEKNTLKLSTGETVSHDFVLDLLIEYEFERVDFVAEPGQFSLRGGLIDVYSFSGEHPYRIEFDGEKVASIRTFDPSTQLSIERKTGITIVPDISISRDRKITNDPVFRFISDRSVIWAEDLQYVADLFSRQEEKDLYVTGQEFTGAL